VDPPVPVADRLAVLVKRGDEPIAGPGCCHVGPTRRHKSALSGALPFDSEAFGDPAEV
jgi:hypothetical protein